MLEAFRHVVHAAGYSAAGLRHMFGTQIAARVELVLGLLAVAWFLILGRSVGELIILVLLFLALLGVEAVNTAIEQIVDHLSPEHSDFAMITKDLGSAAVGLFSVVAGIYVVGVTCDAFGLIRLWGTG